MHFLKDGEIEIANIPHLGEKWCNDWLYWFTFTEMGILNLGKINFLLHMSRVLNNIKHF